MKNIIDFLRSILVDSKIQKVLVESVQLHDISIELIY